MSTLNNAKILVTRPEPDGLILSQKINDAGGQAVFFPTISIHQINDAVFLEQIAALDTQDWLIFISPQSVYTSSVSILSKWSAQLSSFHVAAVGAGTAKALNNIGFETVIYPDVEWNSEGLMKLPVFSTIKDKKVTLFCGRGGNDWLAETLLQKGAILTQTVCYERCLPGVNVDYYLNLLRKKELDTIICTSGEGLVNLTVLLKQELAHLSHIPIVVISQRMVVIASDLGFKKIFLAKNATHDAIMEQLFQCQKRG